VSTFDGMLGDIVTRAPSLFRSVITADLLHTIIRVCDQLPTSAVNVALPAFAAAAPVLQQPVDISYPPRANGSKPAACCSSGQQMGQTDRETDGQTDTVPLHRPWRILRAVSTSGDVAEMTKLSAIIWPDDY